jgi:hypothetical protein
MPSKLNVRLLDYDNTSRRHTGPVALGTVVTKEGAFGISRPVVFSVPDEVPKLSLEEAMTTPTPPPPLNRKRKQVLAWPWQYLPIEHPDSEPTDMAAAVRREAQVLQQVQRQRATSSAAEDGEGGGKSTAFVVIAAGLAVMMVAVALLVALPQVMDR